MIVSNQFRKVKVRTWFLRFRKSIPAISSNVVLEQWLQPDATGYLELYCRVGSQWGWTGRLLLTKPELEQKLNAEWNEVWLFKLDGKLKGFFEIDRSSKGKAEIVYLGLLPEEIGKGYGTDFLNSAIAFAGNTGDDVWLHTCEFDHPKSLAIYQKVGFEIYDERVEEESYPINWSFENGH